MADNQGDGKNNAQLLRELEALSQSLYQSHTARRTASVVLPRTTAPPPPPEGVSAVAAPDHPREGGRREPRPRPRRLSLSPWRSGPKHQPDGQDDDRDRDDPPPRGRGGRHPPEEPAASSSSSAGEKKGIWGWKPMRALSHIGMQRLGCLFSVEVVSVQGLPASMNGLRLCVAVRKKEGKDGTVQTMPSRVLQGCADFEETLFLRCHLYCTGGGGGKSLKFEPRPFLIYAVAVDAPELDFGRSTVDLSLMVRDSVEKNFEGARVRQWDRSFDLSGKARGGEMVLKLGFQIMEDGAVGIYNQPAEGGGKSGKAKGGASSPFARRHSKSSFSVTSPRVSSRTERAVAPSHESSAVDFRGIDDFNLDEPAHAPPSSLPSVQRSEPDAGLEDLDLPDFEIVDKGVEVQAGADGGDDQEEEAAEREQEPGAAEGEDEKSPSSDVVVKEVVASDPIHRMRLTELDSIAKQIAALESTMAGGDDAAALAAEVVRGLDADEETVTREFLQMLELEDGKERRLHDSSGAANPSRRGGAEEEAGGMAFVSDLGKGLGSVVQTKDGGYLVAMNPFNTEVQRQETPKLAMQISKPMVIGDKTSASGFELFQRMAAMGADELASALTNLAAMDDLKGKTAEQIAFEGIASAIISGRNTEGASSSSSAAKSISAVKAMVEAMGAGRRERLTTGIWNVSEEPVTATEVLAFVLQKVEAMAVEALKIQAGMAEEEAPFEVFTLAGKGDPYSPLAAAVTLEEWRAAGGGRKRAGLTLLAVVQTRDPVRGFEAVGGPVVAVAQASAAAEEEEEEEEEEGYEVGSLHMGGLSGGRGRRGGVWDAERQRLTAAKWVVGNGMGGGKAAAATGKERRAGKGGRGAAAEAVMWSMSARVMAGMWLKPVRNPDVKFNRERENA